MPWMGRIEQFTQNLREARLERGLSQEALGRACALHRTEISLLERAGREPRLTTMVRIANALDVRLEKLLANIR